MLSIKVPAIKMLPTPICYVQTLLSAQPGLGTQPHKEAPGTIWFKYVKTHWLTLGQWGCPLDKKRPKNGHGSTK